MSKVIKINEAAQMIEDGMPERDAANTFAQKVLGSIDR